MATRSPRGPGRLSVCLVSRGRGQDGLRVGIAEASPGDHLIGPDEGERSLIKVTRIGGSHIDDFEIEPQSSRGPDEAIRGGRRCAEPQ